MKSPRTRSTTSHAVRVLCAEDHPLVVDGLAVQFAISGAIEIVGRLRSADNLVAEARRLKPHAVLLDIEMPGADALETADRLHRICPDVRIIVLSAHARDSLVRLAFSAGVSAYYTKSDDINDIIRGILQVIGSPRGTFLLGATLQRLLRMRASTPPEARAPKHGPSHAGSDAGADADAPPAPTASLLTPLARISTREREVLRLIGKGLGRVEIARQLSRSVKTIDGHQERLMAKLGVTARADLVRLAIREGLAQA